jgi:3-oxoacyl-[acyl-carrier-protein] synthase II
MARVVITGTGVITAAGTGTDALFDAMESGVHFFRDNSSKENGATPSALPWPLATANWPEVRWPEGDIWINNAKYANLAARVAVAATNLALERAGMAEDKDSVRCGTVMAVGSSGSDELSAIMPKLALLSETDSRALATLLYEEVPDYSYIRGIPSQLGQFVSMATGFRGSNVAVYGETGAGGLSGLSLGLRLIETGELERVIVVGVSAPAATGALVAMERHEPIGLQAKAGRGPFDVERSGVLLGYGAVAIVLENEETARSRGSEPLARLVACETLTASSRGAASAEVTRLALDQAGERPGVWWSSGAGSVQRDQEECQAIGPLVNAPATSSKGTIGTAFECGGLIDVALAVESLARKRVPPIGLLQIPDPALGEIDFVIRAGRAVPEATSALVTSLGFGENTTSGAAIIATR